MLKNKDILEKFEITKSTLYQWKISKPNLYKYLQNADNKYTDYRNLAIIVEKYSKEIQKDFLIEEIEFILSLHLIFSTPQEIEELHFLYATKIKNSSFTLGIFTKLQNLNLIEKYIFSERMQSLGKKQFISKEDKIELTRRYFKEFLATN